MGAKAAYEKLFGVIKSGLGAVFPWLSRRLAEAEATRVKLLGAAQIQVEVERERSLHELRRELAAGTDLTDDRDFELLAERARFRVQDQERKRQRNLEQIVYEAVLLLPEVVSEDPVDADFVARFFTEAQDVSSPTMQRLWAKILSGEVVRPGSCGTRTLDVLRNISIDEAQQFESLRRHVCYIDNPRHIFLPATVVTTPVALALDECGLVLPERSFRLQGANDEIWWGHGNLAIRFTPRQANIIGLPTHLGFYPLTRAGETIMSLDDVTLSYPDTLRQIADDYSKYFEIAVSVDNGTTSMSLADYLTTALR